MSIFRYIVLRFLETLNWLESKLISHRLEDIQKQLDTALVSEVGFMRIGRASNIQFKSSENPCAEIVLRSSTAECTLSADIVDDDINDDELTDREYSNRILDSIHNLKLKGIKIGQIDSNWFIIKSYRNGIEGNTYYLLSKSSGRWMNYDYVYEIGELHKCSFSTRNDAFEALIDYGINGQDGFVFDDIIEL